MSEEISQENVLYPLTEVSSDVERIIKRVIKAEKDKIHMKTANSINKEIKKIIEEEIK
jgi:hypothetical protein